MSAIVAVGASEKGQLLLDRWARNGHETSAQTSYLANAEIALIDVSAAEVDLQRLAPSLAGKIVIDCSNVAGMSDLRSKTSVAEEVARACPNARIVKAFNVVNLPTLQFILKQRGPEVNDAYTSGFYCGDDANANSVVAGLISEANLDPVDCGPLANAILLESLGTLYSYLEKSLGPIFSICVAGQPRDRSPLDSVM